MSTTVAEKIQDNASVNDPSAVAMMQQLMGMPNKDHQLIGANNPAPPPNPAAPPPVTPAAQAPPAAVLPVVPPVATPAAPINTPLGELIVNPVKGEPVNIANFEDAFKHPEVAKVLGMEIKTPQEFFEKLLPVAEKWRSESAKAVELETKNKNLIESVKMLPAELKGAISTYYEDAKNGTDNWKSLLNNTPLLNFKDPVEKVSKEVLINTYHAGKFTADELADPENKAVQIAEETSKQLYTAQRQAKINDANQKVRNAQLREDAISASIETSIQSFGNGLPIKPDEGRKGQVEQMMKDGTWMSAFVNDDLTFKPDAATKIGIALHYQPTFEAVMSAVSTQVMSQANEAAVDKADVTKVTGASGSGEQAQNHQANAAANELVRLMAGEKPHF